MKAWASPTPSPDASTCSPSDAACSSNRSSLGPNDAVGSPALFLARRCWDLESHLLATRAIAAWRLALESVRREEAEAEAMQLRTEVSLLQARLDSILGSSHQPAEKPDFRFSSTIKKPSQAVARCVSAVVINPAQATAEKLDRKAGAAPKHPTQAEEWQLQSTSTCESILSNMSQVDLQVAVAVPVQMPIRQDSRAMELERWRAAGRPNCTRAGSASSSRTDEGTGAGYTSATRGRCAPSPARAETSVGSGKVQHKTQPLRRRLGFDNVR
eukprot:TRINITY_DN4071_c0_g1_i2.p1 TRINITY_DN4071_c0_g1~~TRINITY_DN4071_c0_g1_i2.p1  ORF type:complete len:271 (-),score=40.42 TRINITY_DN4071_c0_g1_i2:185-997(-)